MPNQTKYRFRNRRGRPKSVRLETDCGTPELQRHRTAKATAEPLDNLLAHKMITENEHKAALRFRWLYTLRHGITDVRALRLDIASSAHQPRNEDWQADREEEYRETVNILISHRAWNTLVELVIFQHPLQSFSQLVKTQKCLHHLAKQQSRKKRINLSF